MIGTFKLTAKELPIEIQATCGACGISIVGTMRGDMVGFVTEPCEHFRKLWEKTKIMAFIEVTRLTAKEGGVESK